jgi:hypothetical protein
MRSESSPDLIEALNRGSWAPPSRYGLPAAVAAVAQRINGCIAAEPASSGCGERAHRIGRRLCPLSGGGSSCSPLAPIAPRPKSGQSWYRRNRPLADSKQATCALSTGCEARLKKLVNERRPRRLFRRCRSYQSDPEGESAESPERAEID